MDNLNGDKKNAVLGKHWNKYIPHRWNKDTHFERWLKHKGD